jgi:hypothetical protein
MADSLLAPFLLLSLAVRRLDIDRRRNGLAGTSLQPLPEI